MLSEDKIYEQKKVRPFLNNNDIDLGLNDFERMARLSEVKEK